MFAVVIRKINNFSAVFMEKHQYDFEKNRAKTVFVNSTFPAEIYMDQEVSYFENGQEAVIFEGVLYNKESLCARMGISNSIYIARIILDAYRKWGKDFLKKIDGKYSFVIIGSEHVIGGVDKFGEKKLCYFENRDGISFSTDVRCLAEVNHVSEISVTALGMYFAHNYICAPYTIYENIFKLEPGESIFLNNNYVFLKEKYWSIYEEECSGVECNDIKEEVITLLQESIRKRWVSGGYKRAAIFLSGGIDSAMLCKVIGEMKDIEVIAYTALFKNAPKGYDESSVARQIAEVCGVEHKIVEIDADELQSDIYNILSLTDEPMANRTYSVATILAREAAKECDCLFTGDGGDELFFGYPQYQRIDQAQKIYEKLLPVKNILCSKIMRKVTPEKLQMLFELENSYPKEQMFTYHAIQTAKKTIPGVSVPLTYAMGDLGERKWFLRKNILDIIYGTQPAIRKWNEVSGDNGIMHFSPILDSGMLGYSKALPLEYKMNKKENKIILREIVSKILPEVSRLPKHGFNVPVADWIKYSFKDAFETITSTDFIEQQGLFDTLEIRKLKKIFIEGQSDYKCDADTFMWDYFVFQMWYKGTMEK